MNHSVRTFRAATADEALAQVRRELGADAVVVEVKQVSSGGLFGWMSSRRQFEVTASRAAKQAGGDSAKQARAKSRPTSIGTVAAAAAAKSMVSSGSANAKDTIRSLDDRATPLTSDMTIQESSSDHAEMAPTFDRQGTHRDDLAPPPPLLPELPMSRNRIEAALERPRKPKATSASTARHNLTMEIVRSLSSSGGQTTQESGQASADAGSVRHMAITFPNPELASPQSIEQRLDALQQMIANLGQQTQARGLIDIPPELFPHYLTLVEAEVPDDLARELIQKLHRHAAPGQLSDTASTMALLTAMLEPRIPCDRALSPMSGRRQIAMVVGPTGVGKTTTLAKLAGQFGLEAGCKLGLITVDTYRVAAVEQLRTYAEIIDLPMRVVTSATEMQEALDSFIDCDLVLIDTAGRSPHDDRRLTELKQLIDAACPDHVYLVLSLAAGASALRAAAERFAAIRPTSLVLTKLDEATGCGGLLSAARDIGLPISYLTTGQEVPRDIEPANPCRAARLILGTDVLNHTNH